MSEKIIYLNREGKEEILDLDMIRAMHADDRKIGLIKELRRVTGKGLKESKDLVEANWDSMGDMVNMFIRETNNVIEPYTKEEFLQLVERCIDGMESLQYDDMLEATMQMLQNVKNRGGLEKLAKDRDLFLHSI